MARAVLALDIGGTKLAAGVVDASGCVHSFLALPSRADEGPEPVLARLFDLGRGAVERSELGWDGIDGVGIACGGPLDPDSGVLLSPPHLPGWHDVPVTSIAQGAYGKRAVLENDATAAAWGEHRHGAGAGTLNMVYLTLSTGVGGGVVMGGRLYRGSGGNGAELGHVTVDWRGRLCRGCGRNGCLEAYASGTSIAERMHEALALRDGGAASRDGLTAADVVAAASSGDPIARDVWQETIDALACGLTSIVNLFEPELVVLGGGVSRSGEQLFGPVREWVRAHAIAPAGRAVEIVPSALGDHVGVVGAAAIAYDRITTADVVTRG
jgi:glucokinase